MSLQSTASDDTTRDSESRWFSEEVQPHEFALRRWLRAKFPAVQEIDDLIQDCYLRVLRARKSEELNNPKAYLFATARNAALDHLRKEHRLMAEPLVNAERFDVLQGGRDTIEALTRAQEYEILREAIDSLPPRCREIMVMRKLNGFSNGEIAGRLGLSIHTVNAQLVNALIRCRGFLRARGVVRGMNGR